MGQKESKQRTGNRDKGSVTPKAKAPLSRGEDGDGHLGLESLPLETLRARAQSQLEQKKENAERARANPPSTQQNKGRVIALLNTKSADPPGADPTGQFDVFLPLFTNFATGAKAGKTPPKMKQEDVKKAAAKLKVKVLRSTIPDNADCTHPGLGYMLFSAWKWECGIELRPDMIWHTVCMEVARDIVSKPKEYEALFVDPNPAGKKEIRMICDAEGVELDINCLDKVLDTTVVNTDFKDLLTKTRFSYLDDQAEFYLVQKMVFAYAGTPFFDYRMRMCGIQHVRIAGSAEDWQLLLTNIEKLAQFSGPIFAPYMQQVQPLVASIAKYGFEEGVDEQECQEFFEDMFYIERNCKSGHPYYIKGWATKLFNEKISVVKQFPAHVAIVPYDNMDTGRMFYQTGGLFYSVPDENNVLVAHYGTSIYEIFDARYFKLLACRE